MHIISSVECLLCAKSGRSYIGNSFCKYINLLNYLNFVVVTTIRSMHLAYGVIMKVILRFINLAIFFLFCLLPLTTWAQNPGTAVIPDDEAKRCRYGADHMIEIAKQSLLEPTSRPERIAKSRKLVEEWLTRLDQGEAPCLVYIDIQKAATTF